MPQISKQQIEQVLTALKSDWYRGTEDSITMLQSLLDQPEGELVVCTTLRMNAIRLYKPPFKFEHGYIFDADHHMVADDDDVESHVAARVRGWGRIGYMEDSKALQDEVGKHIAELLTKHWSTVTHPPAPRKITANDVTDEMVDEVEDVVIARPDEWDVVDPKEIIAAAVNAYLLEKL